MDRWSELTGKSDIRRIKNDMRRTNVDISRGI